MAFALLYLAPLAAVFALIAQVLWVRRRVLRLPEAEGSREGGDGSGLRLLLCGESPAAGVGVERQEQGLAARLAERLEEEHGLPCRWRVEARSGLHARELPALLSPEPADVAVLVLGVNDAKGLRSRRAWLRDLHAIDEQLRAQAPGILRIFCSVPDLSRFPALPAPLSWLLGLRARRLDRALAAFCEARERCLHFPVEIRDDGDFAPDGFHPGPRGYGDWAAALAETIARDVTTTRDAS